MGQDTLKKLRADMAFIVSSLTREVRELKEVVQQMGPPYVEAGRLPIDAPNGTTFTRFGTTCVVWNGVGFMPGDFREDGAKLLPDLTWQFPNAPTGPVVDHPPAQMPAVPAAYGKGAIVRRKGQPFTSEVQAVGDGLIYVTVMDNGEPKDIWAPWGDFDLLSAAPV